MTKIESVKEEIKKFLSSGQRSDGGFDDFFGRKALVLNALVLFFLPKSKDKEISAIREKAAGFILRYKSQDWIFSENFGLNFLILCALSAHDPLIFSGEDLAKITQMLVQAEKTEGGPYFSSPGSKDEVDLFANIVIFGFLKKFEVELPNLNRLIEGAIEEDDFSWCLARPLFVIYSLSKFYQGEKTIKLSEKILEKIDSVGRTSAADEMLSFCSLVNLGCRPDSEIEKKFFLSAPFLEKLLLPARYFSDLFDSADGSSQVLNSALYLEVLEKLSALQKKNPETESETSETKEKKIIADILRLGEERFFSLPPALRESANSEIGHIAQKNSDRQMLLMPYYFRLALGGGGRIFSDEFIARTGLANAFFWTAFVIYDDLLDGEGDSKLIPTANIYAREFTGFFRTIFPAEHEFNNFFSRTMDKLDAANAQEVIDRRATVANNVFLIPENIPDYGDYEAAYAPSSAHIFGPLSMSSLLGFSLSSEEVENLISYFRHYLIAMQINDDIYDWEEDLRRGRLSTAAAMLLRDWLSIHPGSESIDLEKEINDLRQTFYFTTLEKISAEVLRHTKASRVALRKVSFIENFAPLEKFINLAEIAAKQAFDDQKTIKDFLKSFKP